MNRATTDESAHGSDSLLRHAIAALPVIVVVSTLVFVAGHYGLLERFETPAIDAYLASLKPRVSEDVVVVGVTEGDYSDLFGRRSPLDETLLVALLEGVAVARPAAVGVDLDTADWTAAQLSPELRAFVWARDADVDETGAVTKLHRLLGRESVDVLWGLPHLPRDPDGLIRRHQSTFTDPHHLYGGATLPSLGAAIVERYCGVTRGACAGRLGPVETSHGTNHPSTVLMAFSGGRSRFRVISAQAVLAAKDQPWWRDSSPLRDRIVIVGGLYRAARDEYVTPLGPFHGVELQALSVEAELGRGAVAQVNHAMLLAIEVLAGLVLVLVNWRFPPGTVVSLFANGLSVVGVAFVGSYLAFSMFSYWASFVPLALAVRIHQTFDWARENRKIRHEWRRYRALYGALPPHTEPSTAAPMSAAPRAEPALLEPATRVPSPGTECSEQAISTHAATVEREPVSTNQPEVCAVPDRPSVVVLTRTSADNSSNNESQSATPASTQPAQ